MPGVAQRFQEHVASFYGKFTPTADSTEECIVICVGGGGDII